LTVRLINRTETQVGHSDPVTLCGKFTAQQIKGTLGITDSSWPRVLIDAMVWYLDVECDSLLVRKDMYFS